MATHATVPRAKSTTSSSVLWSDQVYATCRPPMAIAAANIAMSTTQSRAERRPSVTSTSPAGASWWRQPGRPDCA
jgi:hypothetical protein